MSDELEPISPRDAVDLYLDHRETDVSEKTLQNQRYRLDSFVDYCDDQGIENLKELTGRDLHHFRVWRRQGKGQYSDVNSVTLKGILATLRVFLEFAASIEAVEDGMRERVLLPDVDPEDESSDDGYLKIYLAYRHSRESPDVIDVGSAPVLSFDKDRWELREQDGQIVLVKREPETKFEDLVLGNDRAQDTDTDRQEADNA